MRKTHVRGVVFIVRGGRGQKFRANTITNTGLSTSEILPTGLEWAYVAHQIPWDIFSESSLTISGNVW
jgi:hypothetical protein